MTFRNKLTVFLCFSFSGLSAAEDSANDLQVGGFFSHGYLESSRYSFLADTEGGTTSFIELGLNASWTAKDRLTVNGQLFAFELGAYGNFEPLVDYLFLDYNVSRELGLRLGRVKRELGIFYHVQDIDLSRTSAVLPIGVYDQRFRDISASVDGVSAYGNLDLWDGAYLDYTAYIGCFSVQPDGGVAGYALTELSREVLDAKFTNLDADYSYGVQFWLSPGVEGLLIGLGSTSLPDMNATIGATIPSGFPVPSLVGAPTEIGMSGFDMSISHLSLEYYIGTWNFSAEYALTETNHIYTMGALGVPLANRERLHEETAWYLSASKRLGRFEAAVTYVDNRNASEQHLPPPATGNLSKDKQFSLRYDVNDHWTLKAEIHSIEGTRQLFNQLNQNPVLDENSWTLFAAKSTFYF